MYFLVNVSPPKQLDVATSNFAAEKVTLNFIFRLVLYTCSHEDVSFNIICLNLLGGI